MSIPFTQFKMPEGRRHETSIDRPPEIESEARDLINAGYKFEMLYDYTRIAMYCTKASTLPFKKFPHSTNEIRKRDSP